MPGYTKSQLEAKGASLANYVLCERCSLYWHKRSFIKHLRTGPALSTPDAQGIAIIHPAWQGLLDFLVRTAADAVTADRERKPPRHGRSRASDAVCASEGRADGPGVLSVEEAVRDLGVDREEILAEFAENAVPFEVVIPGSTSRKCRR